MNNYTNLDIKHNLQLFGLTEYLNFLINLLNKNKLPKVIMLSGKKGNGKSTLFKHFLNYVFDNKNYNLKEQIILEKSIFNKQIEENIHPNIIFLSGSIISNIKIDDIRKLKNQILQSSMSDKKRFIVLDDVELFNKNSLNALLKIIEEPSKRNYFILINNYSRPLIETIKSRCLDIKILLKDSSRVDIINSLIKFYDLNQIIDPHSAELTPGNFLKFNSICVDNAIVLNDDYFDNLQKILKLYKKKKDIIYIEFFLYITEVYFKNIRINNKSKNIKTLEINLSINKIINEFYLYNLNQNSLMNAINNRISNE